MEKAKITKRLSVTGCCVCGGDHADMPIFKLPKNVKSIVTSISDPRFRKFVVCPVDGVVVFYSNHFLRTGRYED